MMPRSPSQVLASVAGFAACMGTAPVQAAIYGVDDRVQVYDETDEAWRSLAEQSIVLKLRAGWGICDGAAVSPTTTLGERQNLCEGEAFIDDPVLASCSATLVDDDLIVIARHCVLEDDACATSSFAPGLRYTAPGELFMPGPDDIYGCRRVVAELQGVDIAFVQLDRPVVGMVPAVLGPTPAEIGAPLGVIGFPTGVPMKIARSCNVVDFNNQGLVRHDCDTFLGNSGSGVFDGDGLLWGVHVQGPGGDYEDTGDCSIAKLYTQDGHIPGIDSAPQLGAAAQISDVLPTLCDGGWPTPLCGTTASCGDGVCSGTETAASCDADCSAPQCGDGICEVSLELDCVEDCGHVTEICEAGGSTGGSTGDDGSGSGTTDAADTSGGTEGIGTTTGDVEATSSGAADSSGGAPADDGSDDGGGCSCRSGAPTGGAAWALLLLPLWRRRRPQA
ncbi:MAG: trypsin-like peptidase domain-containing protein [Deltaproteobacteria bacterium]|nr:trypsin-like peptidase domain-containing protein [Deltaproteobacteria bacterium]